jgi:predicted RNase H-like HicB family nuclease
MRLYLALVHKDSDYGISFPDFPGCVTAGVTLEEAHFNAYEALQFHVDGMVEDGEAIPNPSRAEDLSPEALDSALLLVVGVRLPGKARRLNITMDENLVKAVDQAAEAQGMNRSAFLAEGARRLLREFRPF